MNIRAQKQAKCLGYRFQGCRQKYLYNNGANQEGWPSGIGCTGKWRETLNLLKRDCVSCRAKEAVLSNTLSRLGFQELIDATHHASVLEIDRL